MVRPEFPLFFLGKIMVYSRRIGHIWRNHLLQEAFGCQLSLCSHDDPGSPDFQASGYVETLEYFFVIPPQRPQATWGTEHSWTPLDPRRGPTQECLSEELKVVDFKSGKHHTIPHTVPSQEPSVSRFPQDGSAQVRTSDSKLALCPASPLPCQVGLHYTHFADKEVGDQTGQ